MNGRRKGLGPELPNCLKIGQRILVSFDDPELAAAKYRGRLQELSRDGYLCIDAPRPTSDLRVAPRSGSAPC